MFAMFAGTGVFPLGALADAASAGSVSSIFRAPPLLLLRPRRVRRPHTTPVTPRRESTCSQRETRAKPDYVWFYILYASLLLSLSLSLLSFSPPFSLPFPLSSPDTAHVDSTSPKRTSAFFQCPASRHVAHFPSS